MSAIGAGACGIDCRVEAPSEPKRASSIGLRFAAWRMKRQDEKAWKRAEREDWSEQVPLWAFSLFSR